MNRELSALQVITWRVTVADTMSIMLTFTVFEIESSHYPNDETCNSKIQAIEHIIQVDHSGCVNTTHATMVTL